MKLSSASRSVLIPGKDPFLAGTDRKTAVLADGSLNFRASPVKEEIA
jgi:hypothetical protein